MLKVRKFVLSMEDGSKCSLLFIDGVLRQLKSESQCSIDSVLYNLTLTAKLLDEHCILHFTSIELQRLSDKNEFKYHPVAEEVTRNLYEFYSTATTDKENDNFPIIPYSLQSFVKDLYFTDCFSTPIETALNKFINIFSQDYNIQWAPWALGEGGSIAIILGDTADWGEITAKENPSL